MIDIDVFQTVTSVSFEVEPNTNVININKVTIEGTGGGATNLSPTQTATNFTINSDTGTDATIPLGNGTLAGATLNDYTTTEKNKLAGIAVGAEVNVNADWNAVSGDAQILNKPTIPAASPITIVNDSSLFSTGLTETGAGSNATNSIFFGDGAGFNATNANYSNFFGVEAGYEATGVEGEEFRSNFFGFQAGIEANNANDSNFFGFQAGREANNANDSNFIGKYAGSGATSANYSNFIGNAAGEGATDANHSNLLGLKVGASFTDNNIGSNNIIIGTNISLPDATANSLNIGGILFGTGTYSDNNSENPSITPTSGGRIGIGVVEPTNKLHIYSEAANTSGLRLERLTSSSPTSTGQAIGVDASGNIVTVTGGGGGDSVPYTGATSDVNLGEFGIQLGNLEFDNTPTNIPTTAGSVYYNDSDGTLNLILKGGNVVLKNGVDLVARIVNKVTPNTTLTKANYQAVRVSGATGQRLSVELAQGDADLNSADTIGLVTETIATNQEGFIITMGQIENINTTGSLQSETWLDGDVLYLSPTVAGRLTNIKPTGATGHIVVIGYVEHAHAINGKIYVKIMNGWELDELHNVYINNPLNNEGLFYELSTDLWKNKSIATVLGYTPYNATNPSGYQTASQVQDIADAKVANTITNGVTTSAPNQDVVFDALALKANDSSVVHLTGSETIAGTKTFSSNPKIPLNFGNSGIGALVIENGVGQIEVATNYFYPNTTEISYVKGVTSAIQTQFSGKQDALQSTVNIKSINGNSILGSGDLVISGTSAQTGTIIVTSGTSFTTPSTITTSTVFIIELVGAGGGGGGGAVGTSAGGSGAGGGGYVYKKITGLTPSTTYTCAIGVGGTGGAFSINGTSGTSTTLTIGAVTYTASGGSFGIGAVSSSGGAGGTGSNGDINIIGQIGGDSLVAAASVPSSAGGSSPKGWGLGGLGVGLLSNGDNGNGYGGGGSAGKGTTGSPSGGNGSNGIIYCQYFN